MASVERQIEGLKLRLPHLEGKEHKRERAAINKEIYNLENQPHYVQAVKAKRDTLRAAEKIADDEAHTRKLRQEEIEADKLRVAAEHARAAAATAATADAGDAPAAADDGERHLAVETKAKGDGVTRPAKGNSVKLTYVGKFADDTVHAGIVYSGRQFDTTWDAKRKQHKPLQFQAGMGRVIRGWDEAVMGMTLGETVVATIGPKWAYRKAGVTDDDGAVVVPPNATLVFEMTLCAVGRKEMPPGKK